MDYDYFIHFYCHSQWPNFVSETTMQGSKFPFTFLNHYFLHLMILGLAIIAHACEMENEIDMEIAMEI